MKDAWELCCVEINQLQQDKRNLWAILLYSARINAQPLYGNETDGDGDMFNNGRPFEGCR